MPSTTVVLAISVGYLVACLALGMWPSKKSSASSEGFVAGDRGLGLLLMYFITGATIFSAFAFLGAPGWAYSKGAAGFYILGYGALGLVPFYFIGPRASRVGREYGFVTQAQMMSVRFDMPAIAGMMAIVSIVAFVPYLALQMQGAGYVVETMTNGDVPAWSGALVVYVVVTAYVLKSGVLGVGWTNTFQGIFMMALAWGLGLYLPHELYGGIDELFARIAAERPDHLLAPGKTSAGQPWSWSEYSSAVIISIVGFSMWPHLFMKSFTAKSEETIRRTVLLYPTFQIFLVPLFIIGFCGVFFEPPPARADQILPHILMNTQIPSVIVGLFCAGALAASMSSGDAMAHAAASIAVRDGVVEAAKKKLEPNAERRWIRIVVVLVMIAAYGVAIVYKGSLVFLLLTTYGAVVQFAPGVLACLYLPRVRGRSVLAGMIAGSAVTGVFVAFPEWRPFAIHAGAYGLVVNVVVLALVNLGATARDEARRFVEIAARE
ncbi:MAG: sodium:solute symporter family protein [Deltaproteobacteria bacterium]|jgi:SSS family solute:Na+ symporter